MIRLRIVAQSAEPEEFQDQVALIKASGASYDPNNKTWTRTLTSETLTASTLNPLFQAAVEYNTYIEAVQDDQQDPDAS